MRALTSGLLALALVAVAPQKQSLAQSPAESGKSQPDAVTLPQPEGVPCEVPASVPSIAMSASRSIR